MILFGVRDKSLIDPVSLIHFSTGVIMGFLFRYFSDKFPSLKKTSNYFIIGISLTLLWEIFEMTMRSINVYYQQIHPNSIFAPLMNFLFDYETAINVFSDIVMDTLGLTVAYHLTKNKLVSSVNSNKTEKT